MALFQCNECQTEISSYADHCVNCGYPVVKKGSTIEAFRAERVRAICADTSGRSIEGAKVIVHVVPHESLFTEKTYGIVGISAYISRSIHLLFGGAVEPQFNANGIVLFQRSFDAQKPLSSLEIRRNGIVEAVESMFFGIDKNVGYFQIDQFMDRIVASCNELLQIYKLVNVTGPYSVLVSLSGILDYTIMSKAVHFPGKRSQQHAAFLQRIDMNNTDPLEKAFFRSLFEQLWNTFGYMRIRNMGKLTAVSSFSK